VGSRSLDRAKALVELAGQGRPVDSYDEVLEDAAVEAVYIPLPNALHQEWILRSLAAGKHVLCEKPLVLSANAVEEVSQAAAAAQRVVMEGFMYRLHPQYDPLRWQALLARLGSPRSAQVRISFPFNRPGDIREDAALGGGALWDIGCYCLDLLVWQFGQVVEVQGIGDMRGDCDWSAAVQLRFASGVLGSAWWSFAGPMSQRLTVIGERGVLDLDAPFRSSGPAYARLELGGGAEEIELPASDCFRLEIEHFDRVVHAYTAPAIPLEDSARWLRVAEDVRRYIVDQHRSNQAAPPLRTLGDGARRG